MTKDQLLELAAKLSPEDQRELGYRLLDAVGEDVSQEEVDASWAKEIDRRCAEIDAGTAKMIPGDVVRRRLRRKNRESSPKL